MSFNLVKNSSYNTPVGISLYFFRSPSKLSHPFLFFLVSSSPNVHPWGHPKLNICISFIVLQWRALRFIARYECPWMWGHKYVKMSEFFSQDNISQIGSSSKFWETLKVLFGFRFDHQPEETWLGSLFTSFVAWCARWAQFRIILPQSCQRL